MDTSTMSDFRYNISFDYFWKHFRCILGSGVMILSIGLLLVACQSNNLPAQVVDVVPHSSMDSDRTDMSGKVEQSTKNSDKKDRPVTIRLEELTGTLQSIDQRGNRLIMLMDDGKLIRVKLSDLSKKDSMLRSGQRIGFSLKESVEVIRNQYQHAVKGHAVAREAPGSSGERENYNSYYNRGPTGHHGRRWVEVMDVPARVVEVYPQRSEILLITQRGRKFMVKIYNDSLDMSEIRPDESVIARFKEIDEIYILDK